MSWPDVLQILFWTALSIVGGWWIVFGYWRVRSELQRRRDGEPPLRSKRHLIWRDPGAIATLDLGSGPGLPPAPPFRFIEEHAAGSQPCISIRDASAREWRVKWGHEVRTETFATRLAWALGYFAEQTHFLASGTIEGARDLNRAKACIDDHGTFTDARFELSESGVVKHFDAHGWAWHDNPFVGTPELNGLKILMMLISNWDNKDVRDVARGSNTAIFEFRVKKRTYEARYLIIDWGAALGAWGSNVVQRGRWDPDAFAAQNELFVTGVENGFVQFGYQGQRTADLTRDITPADVRWFCRLASALSDAQLRDALRASGASEEETEKFTAALRARIEALRAISSAARTRTACDRSPAG